MDVDFAQILTESYRKESNRLGRKLPILMPDEYQLTADMEYSLSKGTYQFPDVVVTQTDRRVLTRVQDYFSAKVHVRHTPLYFHRHNFVEVLYMYRGHCKQFIDNLGTCVVLQEDDIFI